MPFYLNLKIIISLILVLTLVVCVIFFFAFFAIIFLPIIVLIYLFRKKIFKNIVVKNFAPNSHIYEGKKHGNNIYESDNDFIEVDYESKKEKDLNN